MSTGRTPNSSTLRMLSWLIIGAGVLLLLIMPATLLFFAVSGTQNAHIPGTLVLITSAGGMALLVIGIALRESTS